MIAKIDRYYRQQYYQSAKWRNKRKSILSRDRNRCRVCGEFNKSLHVHHLSYKRFTKEKLNDLVAVCAPCHKKIHKNTPSLKNTYSITGKVLRVMTFVIITIILALIALSVDPSPEYHPALNN